jgi:uncharacterized protein (DUF39 family)
MARFIAVKDDDIYAPVIDYSQDYPNGADSPLALVSYKQLRSGKISVNGKNIPTASISSYAAARKIAALLKEWIKQGSFALTQPVAELPAPECTAGQV